MKNPKKYFEVFSSGASRIAGFGEGTPQQDLPQGQNRRYADFGTVVESCSTKLPTSSAVAFVVFPFHSQHHMKKRFCQLKGAFGENGCEKVLCFPLLPSTDRAAVFPNTFFFFITTTVGKPGLGKMDAKKVAGFQKISAAHGSSLFSFCFHSKGGATAF